MQIFPFFIAHPVTPHLWFSNLCAPAQITHYAGLSPQPPSRSWPIPKQVIHIELGLASQYFSTTLRAPPNLSPFAQRFKASASFPTVITIADLLPFPDSSRSSSHSSFINHCGVVLSLIPVKDSISRQSSSIFPSLR